MPPFTAWAQDNSGGVLLTFGLSQSLSATDNLGFDLTSPGTTLRSTTDLSATLSSQTRNSRLSGTIATGVNAVARPGRDGFETSFSEPRLSLRYNHTQIDSQINANLSFSQRDIAFIDPLTDFLDADGNVVITDDFIDLSGTGTRRSLNYGASISVRDDRPFGLTFSANRSELTYVDATTPALEDTERTRLGVAARFDVTPVSQVIVDVAYNHSLNEDGTESEFYTMDASWTIDRPDGPLSFGLSATESAGGLRTGFRVGREIVLPGDVAVSANAGLTQNAAGDISVTGDLSYSRPLPNGSVTGRLNRSFTTNSDNNEELRTSLSLGATHAVTPRLNTSFDVNYLRSEESATDSISEQASLSAGFTYDLTPDWSMSGTYNYEVRDDTASGQRDRNTLSLTLSRDFTYRP